jgi:uncharacterized membrane protein YeaQ/YmgE (transglycosylase-associated protein family)
MGIIVGLLAGAIARALAPGPGSILGAVIALLVYRAAIRRRMA